MPALPVQARTSRHALRCDVLRRAHDLGYLTFRRSESIVPTTPTGRTQHAYYVDLPGQAVRLRLLGDEALGAAVVAAAAHGGPDAVARLAWRDDFTKRATSIRRSGR